MMHVFLFDQTQNVGTASSLLRFPLSRLNAVFAHREWAVDSVQFEIESAGIAHGLTFVIATPQSCRTRATVCTTQA